MIALACVVGAVSAWLTRTMMNPDGVAYLDLSDQWLAHPFRGIVNAYWSFVYPIVLAAFRWCFQRGAGNEFEIVHLANFAAFLLSLGTFSFFAAELLRKRDVPENLRSLWLILLYSLFLWCCITQITLEVVTPDMLLSAIVWLIAALALRSSEGRLRDAVALGVVCGFAFLTKSVMFVICVAFIAAALPSRRWARTLAAAVGAYVLVAAPWIAALSIQKGRPTFGDTGKLAYALFIDDVPYYTHWHGQPPGSGVPVHPTVQLSERPYLYAFVEPFHVTYPPWFDPSYWNEGVRIHFSARGHLHAAVESAKTYFVLFVKTQWALCGLLILVLITERERRRNHWRLAWRCGAPALFALLIYAVLHVEGRYVGVFQVLLFAAMLLLVDVDVRLLRAAALVMSASLILYCAAAVTKQAGSVAATTPEFQIAEAVKSAGIRPGDAVASIGTMISHSWPRLAGVHVVAEVPDWDVREFWDSGDAKKENVYALAKATGARVIVGSEPPQCTRVSGWRRLAGTSLWFLPLND